MNELREVVELEDMNDGELVQELYSNEKIKGKREYCYQIELIMLSRITNLREADKWIRTLNDIEGRTDYEKSIIREIKKYEYGEQNFLLLTDHLKETFEKEMETLAQKRSNENMTLPSGDTAEARALVDAQVDAVIQASKLDPQKGLPPIENLDVIDQSTIGQTIKDLGYNK